MEVRDFSKWRQKTIVGFGLKLVAPTGQYDPMKFINYGAIAGRLNPRSDGSGVGGSGCLTHTEPYGFSPPTRNSSRAINSTPESQFKTSNRSALSRDT